MADTIQLPPLPQGELMGTYKGEPMYMYHPEQMHTHAAAVSAADCAALRADNTALQNDVIRPLRERVKALEDALKEAADSIADWGAYASEYFQQKHGLKSCIDAARAALEPKP